MTIRILIGDCREKLRELPAASVHTCVTSPPYFGLRDYGTGTWDGGDPDCHHRVGGQVQDNKANGAITAGVRPGCDASVCKDCGATRIDRQMGLEPTPDEFVAGMVEVFREVRRVLRDDGTVWLNIGDSYSTSPPGNKPGTGRASSGLAGNTAQNIENRRSQHSGKTGLPGIKSKDLIGIPWLLAFALRADGWYLRQDIIWHKPNPMPESVEDRGTKAHEYIFLLTKKPRYFYDAAAIAEDVTCDRLRGSGPMVNPGTGRNDAGTGTVGDYRKSSGSKARKAASERGVPVDTDGKSSGAVAGSIPWEGSTRNKRDVWTVGTEPFDLEFCTACQRSYDQTEYRALKRRKVNERSIVTCRCGAEDGWLSHFATFPAALIVDCIKAGCPARCCSECGAPEVRIVSKGEPDAERRAACGADSEGGYEGEGKNDPTGKAQNPSDLKRRILEGMRHKTSTFERTCEHRDAALVPGTVLDPFGGAGTTAMVANREHRDAVLLELNPHYAEMARQRLVRDGGMLVRVEIG